MDYKEITVMVNHEVEPYIAEIFNELGANGVVIEDSLELIKSRSETFGEIYDLNPADYPESDIRVKGYFSNYIYNNELLQSIENNVLQLKDVDVTRFELSVDSIKDEDWENEWKNYFHAFKASEQFIVVPSWENYEIQGDEKIINLDPGMAFGTGDHATTSMCLKLIEKHVTRGDDVIDVGTGSGILSIAAHMLGASDVKAVDLDQVAIDVAIENFKMNNCADVITAEPGNLLVAETKKRDIIVANILAHIVDLMIEDSFKLLNDNGVFITSGIIEEKEEMICNHLKEVGYRILEVMRESGWIAIAAKKEVA